jgi:regulator of sigma E protease
VSWLLAFLGFAALILLHEAGHFVAAKAVGMRVERFAVFFPPLIAKFRRGETEYGIGAIPLGGYVRITGMNPTEDIPPEVAHRAYYRQPVWKRIVVIGAGPVVNIVLAFALLWGLYLALGTPGTPATVGAVQPGTPAAKVLRTGDTLLAVDGRKPAGSTLQAQWSSVSKLVSSSHGRTVSLTVRRDGRALTVRAKPFYDNSPKVKRWRFGFTFDPNGTIRPAGPLRASGLALTDMWRVTSGTVSRIVRIFIPQDRKQIHGVVNAYQQTETAFSLSTSVALEVLALISLSLGIVNLFPFLPLDGGHIFWALAEKVRGRAISFATIERASFVGFALVVCLFLVGLSNDIGQLGNGGLGVR